MAEPEASLSTRAPEALLEAAVAHRRAGEMAQAATALDAVLKAAPRHPVPLRLRAEIALERCEADALARFDTALAADPGNPALHLGKAQALELAGDRRGARIVAQQIAAQAPGFIPALTYLSGLLLASGEEDFTAPFALAARRAPGDPNIAAAHCDALAGIERFAKAAEVAAQARARFAGEPYFALLEAIHAGSAGDWSRADAIYAALTLPSLQRWLAEARHRLRARDLAAAQELLTRALAQQPKDIAAWALQDIAWRIADKPETRQRSHWLHDQEGLVRLLPLGDGRDDLLAAARERLDVLHEAAGMPLSQSLRGGSQTRGILFYRPDPVLERLHRQILATLDTYRAGLPPADPAHPLLAERATPWRLAGSWSVRLAAGGDCHAAHIHPAGLVSSALYVTLPGAVAGDAREGWLELGRPPRDLGLDLEPLAVIEPVEGHLALFPSTLYHSTTPFAHAPSGAGGQKRMTVAFDVITKQHHV
ncbi:MAG: putative 2OG-Fe(II) oxygenase [Erythrobacter sp.]|jgi:tetratricopeptide (TPR) repeat protein|nr:putative 2OG-Fe(II) oxygenase [Erythrobacter sp.]